MNKPVWAVIVVSVIASSAGCAVVRQADLDAWVGVSVVALDTHSLFMTLPTVKTVTEGGVEIRNYVNKMNISSCGRFATGSVVGTATPTGSSVQVMSTAAFNAFQTCSAQLIGCDNIFYIRDGRIVEYRPTGRCFTDDRVRPQRGWERFR